MGNEIAIRVEGLGKRYRLGQTIDLRRTFRETVSGLPVFLGRRAHRAAKELARRAATKADDAQNSNAAATDPDTPPGTFWALRDVSFELRRGEVLGVIGRNGAGKSTLLKLLSRITAPTAGHAEIHGRVGSLLEVGTGFHPELTGRENIYLNGAILGMRKAEIARKFDEIVDFAGVERFLDTPVKRYSSGMYVRLAFAVAAHLEPEVLIVDEVLAVGDAQFQRKCLGKMDEVARGGRTIVFVSHNMGAIENLCQSTLLLNAGAIEFIGATEDAIDSYVKSEGQQRSQSGSLLQHPGRSVGRRTILTSVTVGRASGERQAIPCIRPGDDIVIEVGYDCGELELDYAVIGIGSSRGERLITVGTHHQPGFHGIFRGKGTFRCLLPSLQLAPGDYNLMIGIGVACSREIVDCVDRAIDFRIVASDFFGTGACLLPGQGHYVQRSEWVVKP